MKEVREQMSKLFFEEVSSIRDLGAQMKRRLDRLEDERRDFERLKEEVTKDIQRIDERISTDGATSKRSFLKVSRKVSDCQRRAEEAMSIAALQAESLKVETESILNAVLGKIKQANEEREADLQLLRADMVSLQTLVKGEGTIRTIETPQQSPSGTSATEKVSGRQRRRRLVPQGRRHICWQGCLRCQGLSQVNQAKAALGTTSQGKVDFLAASSDFAESGAFGEDKDIDIHHLVEEMEATCSASNTDHETLDPGLFGPV